MTGAWILLLLSGFGPGTPVPPICLDVTSIAPAVGLAVAPASPAVGIEVTSVAAAVGLLVGPAEAC